MRKLEHSSGAVLYTEEQGEIRYILVQERNGNWGFPKGHIEAGESRRQTALREIREETGLHARLEGHFSQTIRYWLKKGTEKEVTYFLARRRAGKIDWNPEGIMAVKAFSFSDALGMISHRNARSVLRRAEEYRLSRLKPDSLPSPEKEA